MGTPGLHGAPPRLMYTQEEDNEEEDEEDLEGEEEEEEEEEDKKDKTKQKMARPKLKGILKLKAKTHALATESPAPAVRKSKAKAMADLARKRAWDRMSTKLASRKCPKAIKEMAQSDTQGLFALCLESKEDLTKVLGS